MATAKATVANDYVRLSCRVHTQIKRKAEQAAAILGQSITDFTESALSEKAQTVLERHERIALSDRDFARFVELIDNPKPPTPELQAAMKEYYRLKAAHPDANL
jgi:uncharacterized protein (DUF1778 family)